MNLPTASRASWTLRRWLIRLRWPGLLGVALLVCAAAVAVFSIQSTRHRLQELNREAAAMASRLGARGTQAAPATGRSQLSNFYAFFPLTANLPELLGRIHRSARQHGLVLEKGEYRLARELDFRLARYQVTLPVRGDYAEVRGFVDDVLEAVPASALDELTMKREGTEQPELEARVRLTLFLATE
jgi:Tfp pilus assembly protein PilO